MLQWMEFLTKTRGIYKHYQLCNGLFIEHDLDTYFRSYKCTWTECPLPSGKEMSNLSKELRGVILPHDHLVRI